MSDFLERSFPQLIELVYSAAIEPARWQSFLDALSSSFGGATGILYGFDRSRGAIEFNFNFGNDPVYVRSYIDHYHACNPYPTAQPILASNWLVGKVVSATEAVELETITTSEFYNDWMKPQGIPADHFGVLLRRDATSHVTFGLAPDAAVYYRHRDRYARLLSMLVPHMTRALEINRLTNAAQEAKRTAVVALEAIGAAAIILSREGRPLRLNAKAEALMRNDSVLRLDRYGVLHAASENEDKALSGALGLQRAAPIRSASGPLQLTSQTTGTRYAAWLVASDASEQPRADLTNGGPPFLVVLLVSALHRSLRIPAEEIQRTFNLSSAEARLVAALVAGQVVSQYAAQEGLSRNTVRNHLASAFAKTDTNRQSELVALVIGSLRWAAR